MKNLIVAIPLLELHRPPISTAIIAGVMRGAGYECKQLDLNIKLYKQAGPERYDQLSHVWERTRLETDEERDIVNNLIDHDLIAHIDDNTRLMMSVFTYNSQRFAHWALERVKAKYPNCEVVLGGMGVDDAGMVDFGGKMLTLGLADYVVYGEGEQTVLELLKGNYDYPGINSRKNLIQLDNLDAQTFPDYSDFDFDDYVYLYPKKEVNIVGSRGCVRKCTYCNVASLWPKYRFRSGQNIADEMIKHYEQHGVQQFFFVDSLINGSLKAFRDMCDKLADYNQTHKAGFGWGSQFIFKPKRQLTDDYFDMIAAAGGQQFYVGVESGSDKIRWEMDKKFTNEDIDYHLEHFHRTGMTVMFLMIIGYLTETLEDHEESIKMYKRWHKYVANGTIAGIDLNTSLMFFPDTPLEKMIESHKVEFPVMEFDATGNPRKNDMIWTSGLNPDLTFEERMRRRLEVNEMALKYKWPIWRGAQRLQSLYAQIKNYQGGEQKRIPIISVN